MTNEIRTDRQRPVPSFRLLGGFAAALALAVGSPAAPAGAQWGQGGGAYAAPMGRSLFYNSGTQRPAANQLLALLDSAEVDGLDPDRYSVRAINRAMRSARGGDPRAVARADELLSQALVAYVRDLRSAGDPAISVVDREALPAIPSAANILSRAAADPEHYVSTMGWMHPDYAALRRTLAERRYGNEQQRRLLALNLQRMRALPSAENRYVLVNAAAQRLYMYEGGRVVDWMRVVVGKPKYPTPMMAAMIRYTAVNPYWNVPPDLAAERIAPNVVKGGVKYLKAKGYVVLSDWGEHPTVINPATIDWKAVVAGRKEVRLRQNPGPGNSMGRMKFMFPNPQGVYLHDTPNKELLTEAARLFSGGCVRLEDAPRLGRWLYGTSLKAKGARPEQRVDLATPVPVFLTYLTAVPSGNQMVYYEDIYGRDTGTRLARR